jgi:hypothetical protein
MLRKETADRGSRFIKCGNVLRLQGREALGMERVLQGGRRFLTAKGACQW